jgi:hypothetical protein
MLRAVDPERADPGECEKGDAVARDQPVPLDVSTDEPEREPMAVSIDRARAAKDAARDAFSEIGEIVGVGITRVDGDYAVKINLRDEPKAGTELPTHVQGVPIRVEVTGRIVAR